MLKTYNLYLLANINKRFFYGAERHRRSERHEVHREIIPTRLSQVKKGLKGQKFTAQGIALGIRVSSQHALFTQGLQLLSLQGARRESRIRGRKGHIYRHMLSFCIL